MRIDSISLVDLIEQKAGISLPRKARHHRDGPEHWGMCPFCLSGDDRFHVWPDSARPHYWCRVCSSSGDHLQFLKEYSGMTFIEACKELGVQPDDVSSEWAPKQPEPGDDDPPGKVWQEAAKAFIERAERYLWHPKAPYGLQMLAYLRARGLKDETIKNARLGCCPALVDGSWYSDTFEHWGIDPASVADEKKRERGKVIIPPGLVIPCMENDIIWSIEIKQPGKDPLLVLGSGDGLYNSSYIQFEQPVMIVESKLCALSVLQEAGDLINCVATGGTKRARHARGADDLSFASVVLQSFDNDVAGDEAASYWLDRLSQSMRWTPEGAKDPNDMLREFGGAYLRDWVRVGLDAWEESQMPDEAPVDPPPKPLTPEERRAQYDRVVAAAVNCFGGPERVKVVKHDPSLTLEQYMRWQRPFKKPGRIITM